MTGEVRSEISNSNIDGGIRILKKLLKLNDSHLIDELLIIESDWIDFQRSILINVLTEEQKLIRRNRISHSILILVTLFENSKTTEKKIKVYKKKIYRSTFLIGILIITTLVLGYLAFDKVCTVLKQEDYINRLNEKYYQIETEYNSLKNSFPRIEHMFIEYSELHKRQISAIKNKEMNTNHDILTQIHQLPDKYGMNKIEAHLIDKIKSIEVESDSIINDSKRYEEQLGKVKSMKKIISNNRHDPIPNYKFRIQYLMDRNRDLMDRVVELETKLLENRNK